MGRVAVRRPRGRQPPPPGGPPQPPASTAFPTPATPSPAPAIVNPDYVPAYIQQPLQWHYTPGTHADQSDTVASFPGLLRVNDLEGSAGVALPPAGMVGEGLYLGRPATAALVLTSGAQQSVLTLTLPPGDWDAWAIGVFEFGGLGISLVHWMACLSPIGNGLYYPDQTTSAVSGGPDSLPLTGFPGAATLAPVIIATSIEQPLYLNLMAVFNNGTAKAYGNIYARRRR